MAQPPAEEPKTEEPKAEGPKKPEAKKEESVKQKITETLDSLKKNDKIDTLYNYAQGNTRDTIAYVLLILGIILLFFTPFWGGILVGLVLGLYFYDELISVVKDVNGLIDDQGMVRSLVLGASVLAFFIAAPGIFFGAAIAVGIKHLTLPPEKKS